MMTPLTVSSSPVHALAPGDRADGEPDDGGDHGDRHSRHCHPCDHRAGRHSTDKEEDDEHQNVVNSTAHPSTACGWQLA